MSINKVILVGNVGKDPEIRYLEGGTAVCSFPLATSESYRNRDGEKVTNTEWHNIVLWRGLAEIAERYVKKGTQLYIEGRIRTRSWDDKEGNKRYTTEIIADNMQMLGRKTDETIPQDRQASQPVAGTTAEEPAQQDKQASQPVTGTNAEEPVQQDKQAPPSSSEINDTVGEAQGDSEYDGSEKKPDESDDLPF
jgi:single-strand DNA-binding protein